MFELEPGQTRCAVHAHAPAPHSALLPLLPLRTLLRLPRPARVQMCEGRSAVDCGLGTHLYLLVVVALLAVLVMDELGLVDRIGGVLRHVSSVGVRGWFLGGEAAGGRRMDVVGVLAAGGCGWEGRGGSGERRKVGRTLLRMIGQWESLAVVRWDGDACISINPDIVPCPCPGVLVS